MLTYKFKLYPTNIQEARLNATLDACRWVYNNFVKLAGNSYISRNDMNYALTELKEQEPWLNNYHSKMLQMVSTQLAGAEKALIERRKNGHKVGKLGYIIKRDDYNTFTYNQCGFKITRHGDTNLLWLSKIGYIEIRLHRPISGEIKQVTVTRKAGRWYAVIAVNERKRIQQIIDFKNSVGIDVGIKNYAYDCDNKQTEHPHNLKKLLKPLIRANRTLSRRVYGSQNYKKAKRHYYQIIHERIANSRKDFLHKLSTQYARKYDVIFLEKLQLRNMVRNHHLAQSIYDAAWGMFKQMVDYKAKLMLEVNACNSTVECSRCGHLVPKTLAIRTHVCDQCGFTLDRDHNSANVIHDRGLVLLELPMVHREVTPVEILMGSRKQEKPIAFRHG